MKKSLFIITFSFFLSQAHGQTNVYHQFADSNASWNIHFGLYCFMNGAASDDYSIIISGDTLINSQTYHKLSTPYVVSSGTGACGGPVSGYKGAIREDMANRRIYVVPPSSSAEQLLYDFTMQLGDTVKGYTATFANPPDFVQSIDSVLVGSSYRKRWRVNSAYQIDFIEGIGSTYGLIERSPGNLMDYPNYSITCFRQNGQTLFPDTLSNCELITDSLTPIAGFTFNTDTICANDCINFYDQSQYAPTNWSWSFQGGSPSFSSSQNPTNICFTTPGIYTITLIASNANGADTASLNLPVINCVGIAEEEDHFKVKIFPNPSRGILSIQSANGRSLQVSITGPLGQKIIERGFQEKIDVDVSSWGKGWYVVNISDEMGNRFRSKKVLVE